MSSQKDPIWEIGRTKYNLLDEQMEEIDKLGNLLSWPNPRKLYQIFFWSDDILGYYAHARSDLLGIED